MSTVRVSSEATRPPGSGGFRATIDAILFEAGWASEERARRQAIAHLIQVTDAIIAEAEELNLRDVGRISDGLRIRAHRAFQVLGAGASSLPIQPTPTWLIDAMFDAQQILFDLKLGEAPDEFPWMLGSLRLSSHPRP